MKTANLKFSVFLSVLILAFACEKEPVTESGIPDSKPEEELLKSMTNDVVPEEVPDIVVEDTLLRELALVSQYREQFLWYTYDRLNRLEYVCYIRKNSIAPAANTDCYPGYAFIRDKFNYGNDGRLSQLVRYAITEKPQISRLELTKSFTYDKAGHLVQIITRKSGLSYKFDKMEFLFYDVRGNMIRKLVRDANLPTFCFMYAYDRSDRLVKIEGFTTLSNRLLFSCNLFYDQYNNIQRKEFYYPFNAAAGFNDMVKKWTVYYRHDGRNNPFRNLKLPYESLFEWMDVVSPSNITAIVFDNGSNDRAVFYVYKYNNLDYPVLRYRVSPVTAGE